LTVAKPKESKRKNFSVFRSAAEEADIKSGEQNWDNEGGHMSCTSGRILSVPGSDKPFKVIMSREGGETSEHLFATMREAEAFIRRNTPRPPERETTYDRENGGT
jgi:hypothetical protein